jgi:hypothetical protein
MLNTTLSPTSNKIYLVVAISKTKHNSFILPNLRSVENATEMALNMIKVFPETQVYEFAGKGFKPLVSYEKGASLTDLQKAMRIDPKAVLDLLEKRNSHEITDEQYVEELSKIIGG